MTAICALWVREGKPHVTTASSIQAMANTLAMYGRDRTAHWLADPVAMAVCQRHTVPEDRFDQQPALVGGTVVVADVRLDNRAALIRALEISAQEGGRLADSALIHAAWDRWGAECVHHLIGDFAFIVWNNAEQTMFCARDPGGGRPLCYTTVGTTVAVASMPKGVLALPGVPYRLDELRMAEYLALLPSDSTRTFFENVRLLPPGHTLHVTRDRIQCRAYWEPPVVGSVRFARDDDYVEHFVELFDQAVTARLRTMDGGVAALVSGGFDSTSVAALAARQLAHTGASLHALTWVPRSDANTLSVPALHVPDESRHAASLATLYPNICPGRIESDDGYPLTSLPDFHTAWDEPVLNPIKIPMLRATASRLALLGCDVVLTGQGGNMTVSYDGVTLLSTLVRQGRLIRAAREVAALARTPGWTGRRATFAALAPVLPPTVLQAIRRVRGRSVPNDIPQSAIRAEFAAAQRVAAIAAERGWDTRNGALPDARQLRSQLMQQLDASMATKGFMALMGVDFRDPTWDSRLITYCWSIPEDQYLRDGQPRWLFRRAMAGILPPAILHETRRGLQSADWPRFIAPYRAVYAAEVARLERSQLVRAMIDMRVLRNLMDRWPSTWTMAERFPYGILLLRTIGAAQFIQQFES